MDALTRRQLDALRLKDENTPHRQAQYSHEKTYALYRNGALLFQHDNRHEVLSYLSTIYGSTFEYAISKGGFVVTKDGVDMFAANKTKVRL